MNRLPGKILMTGVGLIVMVNAIVLGGVAYNRSGEPESMLRLSERELSAPMRRYSNKENSGLALSLNWRVLPRAAHGVNRPSWGYGESPDWLDRDKIVALGFERSVLGQFPDAPSRVRQPLPRDVLLVLELDGAAYQAALAQAAQSMAAASAESKARAGDALKREQGESSRLFVVDAGLNLATLRAQYPDRSRYAIVHGQVRVNWAMDKNRAVPIAFVSGVDPDSLHVPVGWRHVFDGAPAVARAGQASAHYAVEVKFGKRLEPWISQATHVEAAAPQ